MKFRPHRGLLADSMKEVIEVSDRAALAQHIRDDANGFPSFPSFSDDDLKIEPYGGDDGRIGWEDVHIVYLPGYGVFGFCEGAA